MTGFKNGDENTSPKSFHLISNVSHEQNIPVRSFIRSTYVAQGKEDRTEFSR